MNWVQPLFRSDPRSAENLRFLVGVVLISLDPRLLVPSRRKRQFAVVPLTAPVFRTLTGHRAFRVAKDVIIARPGIAVLGRLGLLGLWRKQLVVTSNRQKPVGEGLTTSPLITGLSRLRLWGTP